MQHIVVLYRGHYFMIMTIDRKGKIISPMDLQRQIAELQRQVDAQTKTGMEKKPNQLSCKSPGPRNVVSAKAIEEECCSAATYFA